jgi:hypothetical protein
VTPDDLQHYRNTWHGHVTLRGRRTLNLERLPKFLEDLSEPLGAPMVPVPARWLNLVLHQVEDMWEVQPDDEGFGDEQEGHTVPPAPASRLRGARAHPAARAEHCSVCNVMH